MKTGKILALLLVSALSFTACTKDEDPPKKIDATFAEDNQMAEGEASNIQSFVDAEYRDQTSQPKTTTDIIWQLPNGVSGTLDLQSSPRVLVINFGTTGILCNDGRTRKGTVRVTWTGDYASSGTIITTTTENYYVNDHKHRFRRVVTNQGNNQAGNPTFNVAEYDTVEIKNNGGTIYWQSNRTREWTGGDDTPFNVYDDTYSITGSASGVGHNGNPYTITIVSPVLIHLNCPFVYGGIIKASPQDAEEITIDYGTGCDANKTALVTIRDFSVRIPLK